MSQVNPRSFSRCAVRAFAAALLCLSGVHEQAFAQTGSVVPPGAPETAPTTLQGNPVPTSPLSPNPVTSPLPVATSVSTPTGYLGLSLTPHFGATGQPDGAFVSSVDTDGPGAKAGIHPADVVTALDDKPVADDDSLTSFAAAQPPGTTVQLSVQRNGTPQTLPVQLGSAPQLPSGPGDLTTPEVDYGPPPFTGTYKGRYHAQPLSGAGETKPHTGTLTLNVSPGGTVTGSIHADTGGRDGIVGGTLSSAGVVSLAFTFTTGASGTINGPLVLAPKSGVTGTLVQSFGSDPSATLSWDAGK